MKRESVVLDATWAAAGHRAAAKAAAERTSSELVELECRTPARLAAQRVARRESISDADEAIASSMRASFADWPEATPVDTCEPPETCLQDALRYAGSAAPTAPVRPRMAPD